MKRIIGPVALITALALVPLFTRSNYVLGILISAFAYTVAAMGLNLIYGYVGLLSFAQLAFWGIGGYSTALAVMTFGGTFWDGFLVAALLNAALAVAIGYPTLRLNRHAFVVVSLAFSLLTALIARDWVSLTRGPLGIPALPPVTLFGFAFNTGTRFFYLSLAFATAALGLAYALIHSRIGRAWRAIKQNEPLAQSQGIAPTPLKLLAFAVGAALTGMASGLYVFHLGVVDPTILDFYFLQTFLIMVIIGGGGSFYGVVVAGLVIAAVPEVLRFSNDLRMVIYGVVLVAAVMVAPDGITGWFNRRREGRA